MTNGLVLFIRWSVYRKLNGVSLFQFIYVLLGNGRITDRQWRVNAPQYMHYKLLDDGPREFTHLSISSPNSTFYSSHATFLT